LRDALHPAKTRHEEDEQLHALTMCFGQMLCSQIEPAILAKADAPLAACLRLGYLTAQRPADVLKLRRSNVRDGFLHVEQNKSGAKLRIALEGELATLVAS
jgi:integrase